jgi:ribosomal-protein-alanine N-acetyltransferase
VSVSLRPMRWWDVEGAMRLERDLFPHDAWPAEQFWSELAGVPDLKWYVVAEEGGDLIGYAGLAAAGGDGDVQTLAVCRDRQGAGLGGLLLRALLDEAARRACTQVYLEVRADNAAAIALYQRHGFQRIGDRPAYYHDGTDALVLRARQPP